MAAASASASRLGLLLSVLQKNPREFWDRIITFTEARADRGHLALKYLLHPSSMIMERCGRLARFLDEQPLRDIQKQIRDCQEAAMLPVSGVSHDAGFTLASFCYAYCRAHQPETVIETGVGNGVTTSFILQALAVNQKGKLWSIDLPPLGYDSSGAFVPVGLKNRWQLHVGRSRRILPSLLAETGSVDLFLHDSLHTYRNMMFEFLTVWPKVSNGGAVISDDIAFNRAFELFTRDAMCSFAAVEEASLFGVAIKPY